VSVGDNPKDGSFEEANSQLTQGLKSCRAVVNSYRSLLTGEGGKAEAQPKAEGANDDIDSESENERTA
jgi:hypothetical protein